jgi:hypothetical protein
MKSKTIKKTSVKKSRRAMAAVAPTAADLAKLGQDLLARQRAIREAIPDFLMPHSSRATLTGTPSRVTDVAVKEGLAACASHPALSGAVDPPTVLYRQDYETAFTELRDEVGKTFSGLDYSIRSKRHENGRDMLRVASMAASLAKLPENAGLKIYIQGIKKGFRRRRRQAAPPAETPAPTPAEESPAPKPPEPVTK